MLYVKIAVAVVVAGVVALVARRLMRDARRKRVAALPFPAEWERIVVNNVPLYNRLPDVLKRQLQGLVQIFLAEKHFEGCADLEITDEVRVTIAAQACMLLLNRKVTHFPKLHRILVYPHTYVAKVVSSDGRVTIDGQSVRLGESWQNGPVVLSWDSVKGGTANITDARNVVLHEFAHQLDQEDGAADGAPILANWSSYGPWARVLGKEYEALRTKKRKHRRSVVRKYGATNPAEFFAVATEAFFEKPKQMKKRHPELYEELQDYYKIDPLSWNKKQ